MTPNLGPGVEAESRAVAKVFRRLVPFTMALYCFNYLDRVNVSFAKLQMNKNLGFSDGIYALGASIFFIGYMLFELPSNLLMQRFGARRWIARIIISWGFVSIAMMFVKTPMAFYGTRLLLGIAEAGFFPAIIFYFSCWIPAKRRAAVSAWFLTSLAISGMIGGPMAGLLLGVKGFGLAGWQWLFLLEGVPTVLLGFLVLGVLPDGPAQAEWLTHDERTVLTNAIQAEHATQRPDAHSLRFALGNPLVWSLGLLYGAIMFAFYGLGFWTPSIVKYIYSGPDSKVGLLSAIPFATAAIAMPAIAMPAIAYAADATGSRLGYATTSLVVGAAGMFCCAFSVSTAGTVLSLSIAAVGVYGALAPFWAVPPALLRGTAAAAGIAIINSIGNLFGGLIGPNVVAHLHQPNRSYKFGLLANFGVLVGAAILSHALAKCSNASCKSGGRLHNCKLDS
jgi:ACS family tartrate transporter-like MFS transporter